MRDNKHSAEFVTRCWPPDIENVQIGFFEHLSATGKNIALVDFLNGIKEGRWVTPVVSIWDVKDPITLQKRKRSLPAAMLSGSTKGGHKATDILLHSGLLQIDLDHVDDLVGLRSRLGSDRHICAAWLSPSYKGVKAIMRIPPDVERHKTAFAAAERYIRETYNVEIDKACSDVNRLCFVSMDLEMVTNPAATPLEVPIGTKVKAQSLAPAPPTPGARTLATANTTLERARDYLKTMPPAVSGQSGHKITFKAATVLVRGYNLSEEEAYPLLAEWNERCVPPWSEEDLRRKLAQAATLSHKPPGYLLADIGAQVERPDFSLLDSRRIDLAVQPPKPVPVYNLVGQQICTSGNLTVASAQAKGGKSAVVGAMLAAAISAAGGDNHNQQCDFLGFTSVPNNGKAVILFDTEQSRHDAWSLANRAALRACTRELPPNFRMYSVVDFPSPRRRAYLAAEIERADEQCGGIHSVFVDGVADLCTDPNDPVEAFGLVEELVQLAAIHSCPIILVLHENPSGAETGKTRGHLGSQLERKAESNLRVVKDAKGVSLIYAERCRHAAISKDDGPRFAWNIKAGMHTTVLTDAKADRADEKRREARPAIDAVFDGAVGNISWSQLKKRIMECCHVKDRTAERRIREWLKLGLIIADQEKYRRK